MKRWPGLLLPFLLPFFAPAQQTAHVPAELLVQTAAPADIRSLLKDLEYLGTLPTGLEIAETVSPPLHIWRLSFLPSVDESELLAAVRRHPAVKAAQFNHYIQLRDTFPDDPSFPLQWQWTNTGQNGGTIDADVDAEEAWEITTGGSTADGREIVVCVVEGANRSHPDLQGNLWFNDAEIPGNGIDDDNNGYVDDYNGWNPVNQSDAIPSSGHGTTVSGMIGARGNNGTLVTGINWQVKIMHVNVGALVESNVLAAYTYPLVMRKRYNASGGTEGAFVVATNSSWGIDNGQAADAPLWCAFYDSLGTAGILSCGATANNNVNVDIAGDLPTTCPSDFLVAVTASNRNDVRTFSGYGSEHIDVAAPGDQIVGLSLNAGPTSTSGTSFASPVAAGIIALLYAAPCSSLGWMALADPAGTALLVREALLQGVDVKDNLLGEVKTGGRVNAHQSLLLLLERCSACPPPRPRSLTLVADSAAVLDWLVSDSSLFTSLRWRTAGDSNWVEVDTAVSPFTWSDLLPCTDYEWQLLDHCPDTTSGFTLPAGFTTDGCCLPPDDLSLSPVGDSAVVLSWDSILAAVAYDILLVCEGDSVWYKDWTSPSIELSDLLPCSQCQVQVRTGCDTGFTAFSDPLLFSLPGCGPCLDLPYCPAGGANASEEWIAEVSIGDFNHNSGSDNGYGNHTLLGTTLLTYQAYSIALTPGFLGFSYPEWFRAWVDFNQDGDFDDPGEEIFNAGQASPAMVEGLFAVPGDAVEGLTRLRVVMRWNNQPEGPCTNGFDYGEVEDYCLTIVAGTPPDCHPPDSAGLSPQGFTDLLAMWSAVPDAWSYSVRYRPSGTGTWSTATVADTVLLLENLIPCTLYEWQVRTDCIGTSGDWTDSFLEETGCPPPCLEAPPGFDTVSVGGQEATLHWNGLPEATGYQVGYRVFPNGGWDTVSVTDSFLILSDLPECADLEAWVRAFCAPDLDSPASDTLRFSTDCSTGTDAVRTSSVQVWVTPSLFSEDLVLHTEGLAGTKAIVTLSDAITGQRLWQTGQELLLTGQPVRLAKQMVPHLPPGMYLVQVHTGVEVFCIRVVKAVGSLP